MRRREIIKALIATAASPLTARAQQPLERKRRIGGLMPFAPDDPEGQDRVVAFVQGLQKLGWTDGRNVQVDTGWAAGDADDIHKEAAELVALAPDVMVATGSATAAALPHASRTVPVVSYKSPIRLAPASSRAWRGRAGRSPALHCSN